MKKHPMKKPARKRSQSRETKRQKQQRKLIREKGKPLGSLRERGQTDDEGSLIGKFWGALGKPKGALG